VTCPRAFQLLNPLAPYRCFCATTVLSRAPANVVIDDDALETAFKMGRSTRPWPLSGRQRSWADSSNCLVGYLAAVCRRLDRSLAVIVQSTPAAGKSAATPS